MFEASASYYSEYRKQYPELLFRRIRDQFRLDGTGSLLDVGCGTGQIALPMSKYFIRVVGVDVSEKMVAAARANASRSGVLNTEFHVMSGEGISSLSGSGIFDLVTYGSALHWMDIPATLAASHDLVRAGGGAAIITMRSIWGGESDWERAVVAVVQNWIGDARRAGAGTFNAPEVPFVQGLTDAGFSLFEENEVEAEFVLDIPFVIGHLYTTSYCNRELLGDEVFEFEHDLTHALLELEPSGKFRWSPGASYIFARKSD
jgi:SAM-dependent methyltransferase